MRSFLKALCLLAACALLLPSALAEDEFYDKTALELASRVAELASDEAYFGILAGLSGDMTSMLKEAAAEIGGEPTRIDGFAFAGSAADTLLKANAISADDMAGLSETAREELEVRLYAMAGKGQHGSRYQAL